jgi:hypothetical protein
MLSDGTSWAGGLVVGGAFALTQWRRFRGHRVRAQTNPLSPADLDGVRARIAALAWNPIKADLVAIVKSHDDWRWASRAERLFLGLAIGSFVLGPALLAAVLL